MAKTSAQKAADLTASFEGSAGYGSLSGNFDKAGISFGFIQFNLISNTLQPVIRAMYAVDPVRFRRACTVPNAWFKGPHDHTEDLLVMAGLSGAAAVAWAVSRQDAGFRLLPHWTAVFGNLAREPLFQAVQARFAKPYMDRAVTYMAAYGFRSERALSLLFDICVQCGSITLGSKTRYQLATAGRSLDEQGKLKALATAVMKQDDREWVQRDILSRKMTIAVGMGVVHSTPYNLAKDFGITDAPVT